MAATLSTSAASLLSKVARVAAPRASVLAARRAPTALLQSSFRGLAVEIKRVAPVTVSKRTMATTATIAVGDKLPDGSLSYFDAEGNLQSVSVESLTKGKKVVFFAVPGAFTPTCSQKHLPGFIENADALKSKGVDTIACVSVNDPFVMRAWGENVGSSDKVLMLADGSGIWTAALGASLDLTDKGLGVRSRRYSLLVDDGVVTVLHLEDGGAFNVSSAEDILKDL